MATPIGVRIQWATNVAELKSQIATGTGAIVAMKDSVDKTARSLGGEGLFRAAHNATAAVQELGGASMLTAAQKEKINAQLTKAIEKYQVLGQKAPQAMLDLEAATRKTEVAGGKFSSWLGQANGLLTTFGIGLSVGALVGFGRNLLNTADQLVKVADRTGLTTTEVQRLQFIAEQSGNSLDQMTNAVSKLQNGLVREDGGVVATVKALGLNFEELRRASPFEQMEQIATAISKVPDPTARAAMAMSLFGRAGAEVLPTLIADFAGLGKQAPVMSDKTVRALEQAGDSLNLFKNTAKVWAAESLNAAGRAFDHLVKWAYQAAAAVLNATASIIEMTSRIPGASKVFDALGISVDGVRRQAQWFTDAATAQQFALNKVDVEVRKTAAAFVDFDPTVDKATGTMTKAERAAEAAKEKFAAWTESVREASFAVQNFLSKNLLLAPSIQDNAASLNAYDLIAEHSVIVAGQQAEAAQKLNAELARQGMLLDFTAHTSNAASQQIEKSTGVFGGFLDVFKKGAKDLFSFDSILTGIAQGLWGPVGELFNKGMQKLVSLAFEGLKKIGGYFRDLFGGPSAAELGGREVSREFENTVNEMWRLVQDKVEPAHEQWQKNNILLREAYIKLGLDGPAAIAKTSDMMTRLHQAEKQGAGATRAVMQEIIDVLNQGLTPAAETFGTTFTDATSGAASSLFGLGAVAAVIKDGIASPIVIPVKFAVEDFDFPDTGSSKGGVSFKPPTQADIDTFLRNNPGDEHRLRQAFTNITDEQANAAGVFSFATGTHGQFMNFGAGQPAMLHGRERVVTEAEGRAESGGMSRLLDEVRALRTAQQNQAKSLEDALMRAFTYGPAYARAR